MQSAHRHGGESRPTGETSTCVNESIPHHHILYLGNRKPQHLVICEILEIQDLPSMTDSEDFEKVLANKLKSLHRNDLRISSFARLKNVSKC